MCIRSSVIDINAAVIIIIVIVIDAACYIYEAVLRRVERSLAFFSSDVSICRNASRLFSKRRFFWQLSVSLLAKLFI